LKPYCQSGFQNSGEKINNRFAEADRLEAGGFDPLGGKSTAIFVRKLTTSNMEETMTVSDAGDILLVENRSPAV
jgi:hypothetical protein